MSKLAEALSYIPADERATWVTMAFAVKSELGDEGFDIWDAWSRTADNYKESSAKAVWRSVKGAGKVTAGTLFHEATKRGWKDSGTHYSPSHAEIAEKLRLREDRVSKEAEDLSRGRAKASRYAGWLMHHSEQQKHAYLARKGFPDLTGLVWRDDTENWLIIPMRIGTRLVGVQKIAEDGEKRFLFQQETSGAEFVIDNGGDDWWVEGYATGLSLRAVLHALKLRYRIHVCFSAGNLQKMAKSGYVIADHDASGTGQAAAEATGLPYWMPPEVGTDLNDRHIDIGLFRLSQDIRKWLKTLDNAKINSA